MTPPIPTRDEAAKTVALSLNTELDAPIDTVWQALTDPALVARWLLPGEFASRIGAEFEFDGGERLGGRIACGVLESDPPHHIALRWRLPAEGDAEAVETTLRITLEPLPEGRTRLQLSHDGFFVPASYPVDRVAEEDMFVLLPMAALRPRRIRRPRRVALFRRGAMPTFMRLAA